MECTKHYKMVHVNKPEYGSIQTTSDMLGGPRKNYVVLHSNKKYEIIKKIQLEYFGYIIVIKRMNIIQLYHKYWSSTEPMKVYVLRLRTIVLRTILIKRNCQERKTN